MELLVKAPDLVDAASSLSIPKDYGNGLFNAYKAGLPQQVVEPVVAEQPAVVEPEPEKLDLGPEVVSTNNAVNNVPEGEPIPEVKTPEVVEVKEDPVAEVVAVKEEVVPEVVGAPSQPQVIPEGNIFDAPAPQLEEQAPVIEEQAPVIEDTPPAVEQVPEVKEIPVELEPQPQTEELVEQPVVEEQQPVVKDASEIGALPDSEVQSQAERLTNFGETDFELVYRVKPGDTIYSISINIGLPADKLTEFNGLSREDELVPGTVISIPNIVSKAMVDVWNETNNCFSRALLEQKPETDNAYSDLKVGSF